MSRTLRPLLACGAALATAGTLAACGADSVPGNAVARVGDVSIRKDTFNHWMRIAAIATAQQSDPTALQSGKTPDVAVPEPPDFTACIADKKKKAGKPARGQKAPTEPELKKQCKTEYDGLKDQVMQVLINGEWINSEAKKQNLDVTDAEVKKELDAQIAQAFPDRSQFTSYIKASGYTNADLLFQQRAQVQQQKLITKLQKGTDKVSNAQIQQFYNQNKARFAQAERRDLRVVLTKPADEDKAKAAKAALEDGDSWASVAKKYSIDEASKAQGGVLQGVTKGQQEKALDDAVFAAKKGQISGPVKTQFGWYVFEVTKVTPAEQQTVQQAAPQIRQQLVQTRQTKVVEDFAKAYQKRYTSMTHCRGGFVTTGCDGAPMTTSTAAAGAAGAAGSAGAGGAATPTPGR